jgi:hypothetical protein
MSCHSGESRRFKPQRKPSSIATVGGIEVFPSWEKRKAQELLETKAEYGSAGYYGTIDQINKVQAVMTDEELKDITFWVMKG